MFQTNYPICYYATMVRLTVTYPGTSGNHEQVFGIIVLLIVGNKTTQSATAKNE